MSWDVVALHKKIDEWAAEQRAAEEKANSQIEHEQPVLAEQPPAGPGHIVEDNTTPDLPKDKRVVRTKTSGDRVYMIDEVNKTRQWVTTPEILKALGFGLSDVGEMEEMEFLKYKMAPPLHKMPDANA